MSVGILVDSSTDLGPAWAAERDIVVAPMHVVLPQGAHRDGEISPTELYDLIDANDDAPRYNGVTNRELWRHYQSILESHDSTVVLIMPFAENPIWQQAQGAQSRHPQGLDVIKLIQPGVGLAGLAALAIATAARASDGGSLDDVVAFVREHAARSAALLAPANLKALNRRFNIAILRTEVGDLQDHIPIFSAGGTLKGVDIAPDIDGALDAMVARAKATLGDDSAAIVVSHALNHGAAVDLLERARGALNVAESVTTELGPTAGAYLGRGALALGYCPV